MKKLVFFFIPFLLAVNLFSQQDEQISLTYFDNMSINAGFAGNKNAICANGIVRNQMLGFGENGTAGISTQHFSLNAPFKLLGFKNGVGLIIKNDKLGYNTNTAINLAYAFHKNVGQGNLGMGFDIGFSNMSLDGTKFQSTEIDNILPTSKVSDMVFDFGLGLFYKSDNLILGVSGKHLNFGNAQMGENLNLSIIPHFYITGVYTYQLSNPLFEVQPSVFIKTGGTLPQVTYGTRVLYNKKFWGGVSYNHEDTFITMFGMELPAGIKFALAYDVPLSKIGGMGSVEVLIGYCFNLSIEKTTPSYKSVRFL